MPPPKFITNLQVHKQRLLPPGFYVSLVWTPAWCVVPAREDLFSDWGPLAAPTEPCPCPRCPPPPPHSRRVRACSARGLFSGPFNLSCNSSVHERNRCISVSVFYFPVLEKFLNKDVRRFLSHSQTSHHLSFL